MLCAKPRDLSANKHSDHPGVLLSFCYLARLPGSTVFCILCCTIRGWQVQPGRFCTKLILGQYLWGGPKGAQTKHEFYCCSQNFFFGRSVKDDQVLLRFVLKLEVSLCQDRLWQ